MAHAQQQRPRPSPATAVHADGGRPRAAADFVAGTEALANKDKGSAWDVQFLRPKGAAWDVQVLKGQPDARQPCGEGTRLQQTIHANGLLTGDWRAPLPHQSLRKLPTAWPDEPQLALPRWLHAQALRSATPIRSRSSRSDHFRS